MPTDDACVLLGHMAGQPLFRQRLNRWTRPGAWESYLYLVADERSASPSAWAQIHIPNDQLPQVVAALPSRTDTP
ncbi:hypothetical protein [Actinomadura litoris]|uniref:hypothetical protein n=1 Tax=Actinomadura litoris TaxID=2678616 RepID=UPI001FA7B788|nr:hypothetical protein [Actinomadura litoris]